jgi:hypothetical protein
MTTAFAAAVSADSSTPFDECPLGGLSLWGKASVTFLTWAEEERRLKAGLDPWTGEPDPYAGMFGG